MNELIPLSLLSSGQVAWVDQVVGVGELARRLGELGFRQGARVQMVQPGSPCIIRLEDSKFCFRELETTSILVRASV